MENEETLPPDFVLGDTIDGIEALNLDSKELHGLVDEFKQVRAESDDIDDFLQFLLSKGAIDQSTYRRANDVVNVRLGNIELSALPKQATVYDLMGKIGEGGMGEIRAARDKHLDRRVALKSLRPDRVNDRIVNRFVLEAQVTAKLQHPNIIPIYSFHGEDDNQLSIAMKLVSGGDLQDMIDEARELAVKDLPMPENFTLNARLELFLKVCDAIAFAHDKGVLHRDLKPANIMLGEFNEVYVMDWGLAKIAGVEDGLWQEQVERHGNLDEGMQTRVGAVIGTPLFMAPEQARGETLDARADQFGLGTILFQLVTLKRMYSGRDIKTLITQVRTGDKGQVLHLNRNVKIAPGLAAIVRKATAHEPEDRYASVAALARDIRRFRNNDALKAMPDGPARIVTRWMSKNRVLTLGLVLSVVLVSSAVSIWSLYEQNTAIQESKVRTQRFNKLSAMATERAMRLDAMGAGVNLAAESLAQTASFLLRDGKERSGPIFTTPDFDDPTTAPPDFKPSALYNMSVSYTDPVIELAAGLELGPLEPTVRRLKLLTHRFQTDMKNSTGLPILDEDTSFAERIEGQGVPIRWAYVSLESGVHMSFPGKGNYPEDYDARKRPWYLFGKSLKGRARCGAPYQDGMGQGLLLPCLARILSSEGEFLGVVGYEFAFDYLLKNHMQPSGPVTHTYLVSPETAKVVVGSDMKQEYEVGKLGAAIELPDFPDETVRARILAGLLGQIEVVGSDGVARVYTSILLPTRDGIYIEAARLDQVKLD